MAGMSRPQQTEPSCSSRLTAVPILLMESQLFCAETYWLVQNTLSFLCPSGWNIASEPLPSWVLGLRAMGLFPAPTQSQVSNGYLAWSSILPDVLEKQHPFLFVGGMGEGALYLTSLRSIKKGNLTLIQKVTMPCLWCCMG